MIERYHFHSFAHMTKAQGGRRPDSIFSDGVGTTRASGACPCRRNRLPMACAASLIALAWLAFPNPAASQTRDSRSVCLAAPGSPACQSAITRTVTMPEIRMIEAASARRTDAQKKISSHLLDALKLQRSGAAVPGVPRLRSMPLESSGGKTLVDIDADVDDALLNAIRQAGGTIVNVHPGDHAIRAFLPLDRMESIAGRANVNSIAPAATFTTNGIIKFDAEGEVGHVADKAQEVFHVDGSGIKVGILSDSIDDGQGALEKAYEAGAVENTLLHVIPGQAGKGHGEGLAMAEIVHAVAPGADIYFATAGGGPAQMAANIRALQEAGCNVIVDDITYDNESPFQDGPIGRAVSDASRKGILYFSSAGNEGSRKHHSSGTWEGDFADGGIAGGEMAGGGGDQLHAFAPGITVNKVTRGGRVAVLFWADPLRGSSNQYNLYLVDARGHVLRSSTSSHIGFQNPIQIVDAPKPGEGLVITKTARSAPLYLYLQISNGALSTATDGNVRGHNASIARNAFTVAAIRAYRPPEPFKDGLDSVIGPHTSVEPFSSDGPRRMFFYANGSPMTPGDFSSHGGRVFEKPDITAADGVTTTLPRRCCLNPFLGTSAAAPHAAAIAALLLSYDRTLKPEDVRDILTSTAVPVDGGKADNDTAGKGVVIAYDALREACRRTHLLDCPGESDQDTTTRPVTSESRPDSGSGPQGIGQFFKFPGLRKPGDDGSDQ